MTARDRPLHELVRFLVLVLGGTGALHGALVLFDLEFSLAPSAPSLYLYLFGLAMPSVGALVLSGSRGWRSFLRASLTPRGSAGVYATAILAQPGLVAFAWLLLTACAAPPRPGPSPAAPAAVLAVGQIWVVLGEELGWRGFLLPRLESLLTPRQATLVLALIWGVWHTPMFFVAGSLQEQASAYVFASSIFAWSAIHTGLYHRSRPSVIPNLVFHASANITLGMGLVPVDLEPFLLASYVLAGFVVLGILRP